MSDTDKLIKNVALDIISLVTLWGISNNINTNNSCAYININTYKLYLYSPGFTNYIALGTSCFILIKYLNM
jgi:hypothetical protein|uniref:Uncharacterized protein n=1 Tax=viral metagenome TaxID=1070528 RepID=A0A6C0AQT5_9ZZZZ